ncbi:MAG: tRNA (adenosine(37)-N6)-dimethylallyltransferase MiaA, partial [Crocinitomicaceae bacterium]|nr:tRNA (adenosine(37)-N6)-dimethylallyltransferase MiaA [Crocinitomicaceae bacterium]
MKKKNTLVVILGPTGIGKTELSIRIAKNFNTEIISADSRQFFKEMNIGVARPTEKELNEVKHNFIANISIHDNFSAGQFERSAMKVIRDIFCSHQLLLCTGGSGLYIDALLYGLDDLPADTAVKQELIALLEHSGLEVLQQELKKCDPDYAEEVDIQNPHRVIRALEVCRVSGKTYSSLRKKSKTERPFDYIKVGLTAKRKFIYDRINRRVDDMFSDGLEEEARSLYPYRNLNPLNTV